MKEKQIHRNSETKTTNCSVAQMKCARLVCNKLKLFRDQKKYQETRRKTKIDNAYLILSKLTIAFAAVRIEDVKQIRAYCIHFYAHEKGRNNNYVNSYLFFLIYNRIFDFFELIFSFQLCFGVRIVNWIDSRIHKIIRHFSVVLIFNNHMMPMFYSVSSPISDFFFISSVFFFVFF